MSAPAMFRALSPSIAGNTAANAHGFATIAAAMTSDEHQHPVLFDAARASAAVARHSVFDC